MSLKQESENGPSLSAGSLLKGKLVVVRVGEEGAESTSYYQGHVEKLIEPLAGEEGTPPVLLLKERHNGIPLHPNVTTVSVLDE